MPLISLENVTISFENGVYGVKNINLSIERGEFVFVLGKSGAGKSTLLKLITKELEPTCGEIFFEGKNIGGLSRKEMPYYRRNFGIVWQDTRLLPEKTVYDNVAFAMLATGQPAGAIKASVPAALGLVGMNKKANAYPSELSGGELFKVALARAVVNNPCVLIADEPTANLDEDSAWDIINLLDEINRCGITVIMATHAKELVNVMRKRVVILKYGEIRHDEKKGKYRENLT